MAAERLRNQRVTRMLPTYELRASFEVRTRTGSSFAPHFCAPTGVSGFPLKWSMRSLIPDKSYMQLRAHSAPKRPRMSLTRIEKYSERSQILLNPPGRMLIVAYRTALRVWLGPGGRRFEPLKSHF